MNNSKKQFLHGNISNKSKEFQEGVVFGVNEILDEAILLLQAKFGHDDIYFKEARKILSDMKIDDLQQEAQPVRRYSINPDNDGQR